MENYKEKYEKLINSEWFKEIYQNKVFGGCPFIINELEETHDEKMIKGLLKVIDNLNDEWLKLCGISKIEAVDWIKRQSPIITSHDNSNMVEEVLHIINEFKKSELISDENKLQNVITCENWLLSLKSKFNKTDNYYKFKEGDSVRKKGEQYPILHLGEFDGVEFSFVYEQENATGGGYISLSELEENYELIM